uniref:Sulfotransferase n=1 Tax=Mantoniella antarctica TaxID=81844 RepID=A0A7S0SRY4_9CHLO|mmetsp:Transcript_31872/g.80137  ORF Transcript_31872/g.80137 Transcript_31872/m.80137 type:complete len:403 (+) Transcript_31872:127-1335(+)
MANPNGAQVPLLHANPLESGEGYGTPVDGAPTSSSPPSPGFRERARAAAATLAAMVSVCAFVTVAGIGGRGGSQNSRIVEGQALTGSYPFPPFSADGCRERLERSSLGERHGGDVVIIPQYKAVYLDIVKSASESIRNKLEMDFNATWFQPIVNGREGYSIPATNPEPYNPWRQKTENLSPEIMQDYTFFTFVRDPSTRLRSSYEQAMCRGSQEKDETLETIVDVCRLCTRSELTDGNPTTEVSSIWPLDSSDMFTPSLEEFSQALIGRRQWVAAQVFLGEKFSDVSPSWWNHERLWLDEHVQSQMFRLSAVGPDRVTPVPMHFIGRAESLDADWSVLMDMLGVDDAQQRAPPGRWDHNCTREVRGVVVAKEREGTVGAREREALATVYKDDTECFGYAPLA